MSVLDEVRGLVSQFRAHLTELAAADARQLQELQRLRSEVAQQADTIDEQREIIARQRANLEWHKTEMNRTSDVMGEVTALAAKLQAQLDQAAHELGAERLRREFAEKGVHPSSLTDVLSVAESDRREALAHVRTILGILDAVGGYMPPDYQAAIRAAREAVSRG